MQVLPHLFQHFIALHFIVLHCHQIGCGHGYKHVQFMLTPKAAQELPTLQVV